MLTSTLETPRPLGGVTTRIVLAFSTVMFCPGTGVTPKARVVWPPLHDSRPSPVPVTVATVPPPGLPRVGLIPVSVGGAVAAGGANDGVLSGRIAPALAWPASMPTPQ